MPLAPGTRLGPYEVLSVLGTGGMGEVYKARDTRLGRDVAIKVLPALLAADPQFRERFDREAKSISQLTHPNICTLHDVGRLRAEGASAVQGPEVDFLVMEFLEGESLATRLEKGALPLADALRIAIEVASALDKAHRHGVVHRDLKPGNVMLTKTGSKLLDFGLAKVATGSVASGAMTALATSPLPSMQSPPLTAQGTILGTFQYMSPEQVEGAEADARADIFAFGAVLFEMVTGQRAFTAKSQASLLAAILEREPPPVSQLVPVAPPALDYVVRTCLAKDPDARFQTARDLLSQLKWIAGEGSASSTTSATSSGSVVALPPAPASRARGSRLAWAFAAVATVAFAALGLWTLLRPAAAPPPVLRVTIPAQAGSNADYLPNVNGSLGISPDGSTLVFSAGTTPGNGLLYKRRLGEFTATPIAGTEIPYGPFFSPNGEWVGFAAYGQLKKVAIDGGASFTLCPLVATLRGASWGEDDFIYFSNSNGPVQRVSIAGGTPEPATTLREGERNHRWVHVLPGGKAILYTTWLDTGFDNATIYAESLITHERQLVARGGSNGRYVASGHVVYARPEGIIAVPFDAKTLKVTGPPRPVVQHVAAFTASGYGQFAVSTDGVLVYEAGAGAAGDASLVWVDRRGGENPARAERGRYQSARLSPNGKLIALEIADSNGSAQIFVFDPIRETLAKHTFEGTSAWPVWTPDSARVTYMSARSDGTSNVYWRSADGSGVEERLTTDKNLTQWPMSWSGDGRVLTMEELGGGASYLTMDGKPARHPMLESSWNKDTPRLSWDGKWLAYASAEPGQLEITVQAFPTLEGKHLISNGGGTAPRWSRDGRYLFYWAPPGKIMMVSVTTSPTFTWSKPTLLFEGPFLSDYDVNADGTRFLMIKEAGQNRGVTDFNVVVNWLQELIGKK
jgi:Tol biopolymer transport system component/predicted Ser/Thr protein kinase